MRRRQQGRPCQSPPPRRRKGIAIRSVAAVFLLGAVVCLLAGGARGEGETAKPAYERAKDVLGAWIQVQQQIAKESKAWEQGEAVLRSRLDLVKKEIEGLRAKIQQAQASLEDPNGILAEKAKLLAESNQYEAAGQQLTQAVIGMEAEVRRTEKSLPVPVIEKVKPFFARMPADPNSAKVTVAERFQNVLGILTLANTANNEITVNLEARDLGGSTREVNVIYVGLGQAYYIGADGEAGQGWPTPDGWKWESSPAISADVLKTLEIIQGKQTAEFVPLPVRGLK